MRRCKISEEKLHEALKAAYGTPSIPGEVSSDVTTAFFSTCIGGGGSSDTIPPGVCDRRSALLKEQGCTVQNSLPIKTAAEIPSGSVTIPVFVDNLDKTPLAFGLSIRNLSHCFREVGRPSSVLLRVEASSSCFPRTSISQMIAIIVSLILLGNK
jgi:hypothetical protein